MKYSMQMKVWNEAWMTCRQVYFDKNQAIGDARLHVKLSRKPHRVIDEDGRIVWEWGTTNAD